MSTAKGNLNRSIRARVGRLEKKPTEEVIRQICEEVSSLVEYDDHFDEHIEKTVRKEVKLKFPSV